MIVSNEELANYRKNIIAEYKKNQPSVRGFLNGCGVTFKQVEAVTGISNSSIRRMGNPKLTGYNPGKLYMLCIYTLEVISYLENSKKVENETVDDEVDWGFPM